MKVRVLRGYVGNEGRVARDSIITVDDKRGYQLIRRGLVTPVLAREAPAPVADGEQVETAAGNPTPAPQPGSQIGADQASSSWAADQPRKTRRSRRPKAAPDASSSMKDGSSPHGQTSSMPPMPPGGDTQGEFLSSEE